jgi:putative ABC transport system permease protein
VVPWAWVVGISFPHQDPIGQRVRLGAICHWLAVLPNGSPSWVSSRTRLHGLVRAAAPQVFIPMFGSRIVNNALRLAAMSFVVRTAAVPEELTAAVRVAVGGVDANVALAQVRTLQNILDRATAQMAFTMVLLLMAAGTALLLGMIGIYGVMSYIVTSAWLRSGCACRSGRRLPVLPARLCEKAEWWHSPASLSASSSHWPADA